MERLTQFNESYYEIKDDKGNLIAPKYSKLDQVITKLGKLEDLFELYNINSLKELELILGKNINSDEKLFPIPIADLEHYKIDKLGNIFSLKKTNIFETTLK